jgi:uncharacterized protein (TIGR02453 family)
MKGERPGEAVMSAQLDLQPVLRFLRGLKGNNNREWFESHRPEFQLARSHFEDYIDALLGDLSRTESLHGVAPKDCIFRLNRDLRFSKDKTPYKAYMSAYIAPGGRKSRRLGYYVHVEPGNQSMLAGGLHEPQPHELAAWRRSIDRDPRTFKKITSDKSFRRLFGEVRGDRLKTAPKGYPKDHPELELLRLKQVTVWRPVSDKEIASPKLIQATLDTFKAMKPFLTYLGALR